jgi:hypothetical protein
MTAITAVCQTCGAYAPVAMLATIGQARQFALCRDCAATPAAVRAFAARFARDCREDDPVLAANRYLAERGAAAQRVAGYGDPHAAK